MNFPTYVASSLENGSTDFNCCNCWYKDCSAVFTNGMVGFWGKGFKV